MISRICDASAERCRNCGNTAPSSRLGTIAGRLERDAQYAVARQVRFLVPLLDFEERDLNASLRRMRVSEAILPIAEAAPVDPVGRLQPLHYIRYSNILDLFEFLIEAAGLH